jgi:hypothetical protein
LSRALAAHLATSVKAMKVGFAPLEEGGVAFPRIAVDGGYRGRARVRA